jgi:hypothetical protein
MRFAKLLTKAELLEACFEAERTLSSVAGAAANYEKADEKADMASPRQRGDDTMDLEIAWRDR